MGRRKRESLADAILDASSRMPWWVGVVLAVVLFLGLRQIAGLEVEPTTSLDQFGQSIGRELSKTIATLGQWIFPPLFLVGAAFSAWKQHHRSKLHADVAGDASCTMLSAISWRSFESLIGEYFRRRGFEVLESSGGADGGVDVILGKGSDQYLVQCKQWRAKKVGVEIARELYGVMAARRAAGGFVVTSGRFTAEAEKFAAGLEIELIDGAQLQSSISAQSESSSALPRAEAPTLHAISPSCPICSSPMVERIAKKGALAGKPFWGCSRYPACHGIRSHRPVGA